MATRTAAPARHPYEHTLQLLALALDRLPPFFPEAQQMKYRDRLARFRSAPSASYDDISATIVELGKASWPLRKAYEEMYARYGRVSEEASLLKNLDEGVRQKFEKFVDEGGKLDYIASAKSMEELRSPSPFERYFTPEEKFAIEQALLDAREQARREIYSLCTTQKRDEYLRLAKKNEAEQRQIEEKIGALRTLAKAGGKWESEIVGQARTFDEGWSIVERSVDLERVEKELEYWTGMLQSFLHA